MNIIFYYKLKELRIKNGMRKTDLARALNVAPKTVSSWERAKSVPRVDKLKALAKLFEMSTDYLLGLVD